MNLHTVAYRIVKNIDPTHTGRAEFALEPVLDSAIASAGRSGFVIPPGMFIVGAFCAATMRYTTGTTPDVVTHVQPSALSARLQAPSFYRIWPPAIEPIQGTPGEALPNVQLCLQTPVRVADNEILQAFVEVSLEALQTPVPNTSRSIEASVLLWLSDKLEPLPKGQVFWLPYTIPVSGAALDFPETGAWVPAAWSESLSLPAGRYAVIGLTANGVVDEPTEGVLPEHWLRPLSVRMAFVDQRFRPGTIGVFPGPWGRTHDVFYNGDMGVWGTFDAFALPKLEFLLGEVLTTAAITTEEGRINGAIAVIKVS